MPFIVVRMQPMSTFDPDCSPRWS